MQSPPIVDRFAVLAPRYDVLLCDVWGVVHNGIAATPAACDALTRYRDAGGYVVLITNAPRPGHAVVSVIDRLGVPREAYDSIVSSGDVARKVIIERSSQSVYHIGPERDRPIFAELDLRFADAETADYVVCTGPFDDTVETPEDYRPLLTRLKARGAFMLCANPDIVVERGDRLIYCAGALADLYRDIGGDVLYAGKPHAPIYDEAFTVAARGRGRTVERRQVLAIGDSLRTDVSGARGYGIDCLFVVAGIHAEELGGRDRFDATALADTFGAAGMWPTAVTRRLVW